MKIKRFEFNMFPENCYVLWDETNEAVVIDPGCFYEEEKQARKKSNEMFNSITEKVKPENQNQTHNSRREGMGPNTKRKPC